MSGIETGDKPSVAVVGSANADLVVQVPRRPGGGETLLGGDLRLLAGGKGANQAAAAGRSAAGAIDVTFVGCVGSDANGGFLRDQLASAGVGVSGLASCDRPTGTAIIFLTPDGENSIVVSPGANEAFDVARANASAEVWQRATVVVLSLEIPLETACHVALTASAQGARVMLNAAPSVPLAASRPEVLAVCDPLIVNEHEALDVLGAANDDPDANDFERLAARLLEAGARSVVVTIGSEGAVLADASGVSRVPAYLVHPVDTTGAGDAFVGAAAAELAAGASLVNAARFATVVAAVSVQRLGAQASYPDRTEAEAFMADRA